MLHLGPGAVGVPAHGGRVAPSSAIGGFAFRVCGGGGRLLPPEAPPLGLGRRGDRRLLKIDLRLIFQKVTPEMEIKAAAKFSPLGL